MQGLAETNRVCRYDRPGTIVPGDPPKITDRSTPVANPRTIGDVVYDLHRLLDAADVPGPYVLVSHSWGGMIGQLFTRTYPDEVQGLVLVDSFAPSLRELIGNKWDAYVEVLNNPPGSDPLDRDPAYEKYDVDKSIQQLLDAPPLREGLPLVVMTKTEPFPEFPAGAGMTNEGTDRIWPKAQESLVGLLPNTPQIIAHGSNHYIQVTEPDAVIAAARLAIHRIPSGQENGSSCGVSTSSPCSTRPAPSPRPACESSTSSPGASVTSAEVLVAAGAVDAASEHPVAAAITAAATDAAAHNEIPPPTVTGFTALPGLGACGQVDGSQIILGRARLLANHGLTVPAELEAARVRTEAVGATVVCVGWDGSCRGLIIVAGAGPASWLTAGRARRPVR